MKITKDKIDNTLIEILNITDQTPNPLQEMNPTNWLIKHKHLLSIRGIEKELGCPSTLQKAIKGTQKLPKKWNKPLKDLIKSLQ